MQAPDLYIQKEIDENGQFVIGGGHSNQKISWVVYADRNDPYMQKHRDREVDVIEKDENEKGKYIMPELYGQPAEKGMFYTPPFKQVKAKINETNENKVSEVSSAQLDRKQKPNKK